MRDVKNFKITGMYLSSDIQPNAANFDTFYGCVAFSVYNNTSVKYPVIDYTYQDEHIIMCFPATGQYSKESLMTKFPNPFGKKSSIRLLLDIPGPDENYSEDTYKYIEYLIARKPYRDWQNVCFTDKEHDEFLFDFMNTLLNHGKFGILHPKDCDLSMSRYTVVEDSSEETRLYTHDASTDSTCVAMFYRGKYFFDRECLTNLINKLFIANYSSSFEQIKRHDDYRNCDYYFHLNKDNIAEFVRLVVCCSRYPIKVVTGVEKQLDVYVDYYDHISVQIGEVGIYLDFKGNFTPMELAVINAVMEIGNQYLQHQRDVSHEDGFRLAGELMLDRTIGTTVGSSTVKFNLDNYIYMFRPFKSFKVIVLTILNSNTNPPNDNIGIYVLTPYPYLELKSPDNSVLYMLHKLRDTLISKSTKSIDVKANRETAKKQLEKLFEEAGFTSGDVNKLTQVFDRHDLTDPILDAIAKAMS